MTSAALPIDPASALTPFGAPSLTEDQARVLFRHYRFIENGGQPYCPHCEHRDVFEYKCRPLFKCKSKSCRRQFSLTSKTPFAYRKISFRKLIYLITYFNHAAHAATAHNLFNDCGLKLQYKTIFVWLHKLRAALKEAAHKDTLLQGEVEVDGAAVGGRNRPSNDRKGPKDTRRSTWRHTHKTAHVVVARQRARGPILTWVAKDESYACQAIKKQTDKNVVFFTDEGAWGGLEDATRQHFALVHDDTFCTPEACTNLAENFFTCLRYAEQSHKKLGDRYLDLYAADTAWRVQRSKGARLEGFKSIMRAMSRPGRSPLAGYFLQAKKGGAKRLCPIIVDKAGTLGGWRQPTPDEWKEKRHGYRKAGEPAPPPSPFDTPSLKYTRSDKWNRDLTLLTAEDFLADPRVVPDRPGLYAILFDEADAILAATGYVKDLKLPVWYEGGRGHLYTGEAYGIRSRLGEHFLGEGPSTLRETLFAIQWVTNALPQGFEVTLDRGVSEQALTRWLLSRTVIAFKMCSYTKAHETAVLERAASPLNIKGRETTAHSKHLMEMRRRFIGHVEGHWPPVKPFRMPVRR